MASAASVPHLDGPFKEIVDGRLRTDLGAPRNQRLTVKRSHVRLIAEHGAVRVSYSRRAGPSGLTAHVD
jgi:hypothetical protein